MALWKKIGMAALVVILILVSVVIYINADRVNTALNSKRFEQVQVRISQSAVSLNNTNDTADNDVSDETAYILKKDKDITYVSISGIQEQYYYTRDCEEYVLIYDDYYGIEEEGQWIEYSAKDYGSYTFFQFSVFDNYSRQDLKKVEDYYIPEGDQDTFFCDFFSISQKDAYTDCDVKFYVERGKVVKIEAKCVYDGNVEMTWVYKFSYKNEELRVPKADNKYDKE